MDAIMRVSVSGLIFVENKVLLVRCHDDRCGFLLGPGGGVKPGEDLHTALKREVWEETRLHVEPKRLICVEQYVMPRYPVPSLKFWFLCELSGGELMQKSDEALEEGIVEAQWYTREELATELVYPELLKTHAWDLFSKPDWQVLYSGLKKLSLK